MYTYLMVESPIGVFIEFIVLAFEAKSSGRMADYYESLNCAIEMKSKPKRNNFCSLVNRFVADKSIRDAIKAMESDVYQ
jgi:hypothetical protein